MTVGELLDIIRRERIDPSRTLVVARAGKGRGYVKARSASERVLAAETGGYVPLETLTDPVPATVFLVE